MMLLYTMSEIMLLDERTAHNESCGIWKHKFRVVSNSSVHMHCEEFWIGQI